MPIGAKTLSFTLAAVGTDSDFPPASFGAALLTPNTSAPLVPTVDAFTDSFYIRDLSDGTTQGQAASGVTVSPAADALPLVITVDISGLGVQTARILFRVIGGGTSAGASVTIDNVAIAGGRDSVPEPASLALLGLGVAGGLIAASRRRRAA